jgi:hypothetical protein
MRRLERASAVAVLLAAAVATAIAALPPTVQEQLSKLPPPLQRQLRAREATLQALAPEQRAALRQRFAAWDALPLAQRREQRERWQAWQALPPQQQGALRDAAMAFAALPPDRQQALRAGFAQLDGNARRGWLLGPVLGARYARLQPLLMQVPAAQREPLLAVLRAMTPAELDELAVLAQRTAPPQRDALRRDLLSTSAANRADWLRAQLDR